MNSWIKRIGFGLIALAIPYAASIPLLSLQGSNLAIFKALMATIGILTVVSLVVIYFRSVEKNYLRESVYVAGTWVALNWALDFVALLPFTGQTVSQYFFEIGVEYLGGAAIVIGVGYLLGGKLENGMHDVL